jgi:hypothetical protein
MLRFADAQASTLRYDVHVQALQVLVLRNRTVMGDGLMQQLAQQQATWVLRELDISLTARMTEQIATAMSLPNVNTR